MKTITLQDLRKQGAKAIPDDQVVHLIVNSRPKAVLVPPEEYEMLVRALEDLEDRIAIEATKHEKGIPLEEAFPELQ